MKNMKRTAMLVSVLTAVILLFSCDTGDDSSKNAGSGEVDYTNHANYSIRVKNNSGQRLVAFKGELEADRIMGGIQTGGPYGLSRNLFGVTSEAFVLILLTEKQYNDNKSNLKALEQTPFTRLFAFYNASGTNETIFEISDRLGGNCTIEIQNLSKLDVEFRLNGIYGETLGFARNNSVRTKLYVNPGDYLIFPVFIKYNAVKNEIITVYPKGISDLPWYTQRQVGEDGISSISLNVSDILGNTSFSTGTAWLMIDNQATDTDVQLQKGAVVQLTPMGISSISSGYTRTYQIDMAKVPGTNKYAETANIGGYTVGRYGQDKPIGNYDLKVDTIYKVTVTGSANAGTLTVSAPVEQGKVDLGDFTQ
jgi:hypothetical protein